MHAQSRSCELTASVRTKQDRALGHYLLPLVLLLGTAMVAAPQTGSTGTNIYRITTFAGDDEGNAKNWYWTFQHGHRDLLAYGADRALPEELPAPEDTNGSWGAPIEGLQLSIRLHRREFLPGEPISAMVLLRNSDSSAHRTFIRNYGAGKFGNLQKFLICSRPRNKRAHVELE